MTIKSVTKLKEKDILRFPATVLIYLFDKEDYVANISRNIIVTYSHASKIINTLADAGLIKLKKQGRRIIVSLTVKGKQLSKDLKFVRDNLR